MGKGTNKKGKKVAVPKANIQKLNASRDGGQIALRGYSYQFLYSCYLILSSSSPGISFQLEGIEDIDCKYNNACQLEFDLLLAFLPCPNAVMFSQRHLIIQQNLLFYN